MKMRRQLAVALTLGLAVATAACDDEFLTTLPQDEISDVIFWQTERDFNMGVTAVYRSVLLEAPDNVEAMAMITTTKMGSVNVTPWFT